MGPGSKKVAIDRISAGARRARVEEKDPRRGEGVIFIGCEMQLHPCPVGRGFALVLWLEGPPAEADVYRLCKEVRPLSYFVFM